MTTKTASTYWCHIYLSGPLDVIEQVCREYCLAVGLCVTVEQVKFIYTGGEEFGVRVGLINYPRFPKEPKQIRDMAFDLADLLLERTHQHSVLVMTPVWTFWQSKRENA